MGGMECANVPLSMEKKRRGEFLPSFGTQKKSLTAVLAMWTKKGCNHTTAPTMDLPLAMAEYQDIGGIYWRTIGIKVKPNLVYYFY